MVQTKDGATENPWITYMRTYAAHSKAGLVGKEYPREKPQPRQESPCICQASPLVHAASHAKGKRAARASASEPSKKSKSMK